MYPTMTMPNANLQQAAHPSAAPNEVPKKYVTVNGVMKLNPAYKAFQEGQHKPVTTALHPDQALAVVSNMDDYMQANEAALASGAQERPLAESTNATVQMMQEPDMAAKVGLHTDELVDGLGAIFQRNEIPMGLMNKLIMLSEFDKLEFLVDDSGSMQCDSDTKDTNGRTQSRWSEAQGRIQSMVEVLAYVPIQKLEVRFLNRPTTISLSRNPQERPEQFIQNSMQKINDAFRSGPQGGTPVRQKLDESLRQGAGQKVARYIFCDGQPNGGTADQVAITNMLIHRPNPSMNPVTLLSCTNEDNQVEWMKEAEEAAPYCAELDDFADEAREVALDQGNAFPFTQGFHLISQLVAAMNPHDLDAMDESVPFTRTTLSNLLGVQSSDEEYQQYFDGFLTAQQNRPTLKAIDKIKHDAPFRAHYNDFMQAPMADQIPMVQVFKQYIKDAVAQDQNGSMQQQPRAQQRHSFGGFNMSRFA